jgi:hypothetical protein
LSRLLALMGPSPWTNEPEGDLPKPVDAIELYFVRLVGVRDGGRRIVFDAEQYYQGSAAQRQAALDHTDAPSDFYVRNRFRHSQVLPLAAGCPIAVHGNEIGIWGQPSSVWAITPRQLAATARNHFWFWMLTDGRQVLGLIEQYTP